MMETKEKLEAEDKTDGLGGLECDIETVFVERLQLLKASRSAKLGAKLGALTKTKNEIKQLMENVCNIEVVKSKMETEFSNLRKDMEELNGFVLDLMSTQDVEEGEKDQAEWYKPKVAALQEFMDEVSK
ncbi:hypothetical protein ABVT39_024606 [Epinephelus coioides]